MKKINLLAVFAAVLVAIAAIVALTVVFTNGENEQTDEKTVEESLFLVTTADGISDVCKKFDLTFNKDDTFASVYDVECFGEQAQFNYELANNAVTRTTGLVLLFGYDDTEEALPIEFDAKQLNKCINDVLESFCSMHNETLNGRFHIFEGEKLLDNAADDSYQKIIDGTAHLEFGLSDTSGYYWSVKSELMDDGTVFLVINKNYNKEEYTNAIPNIYVGVE